MDEQGEVCIENDRISLYENAQREFGFEKTEKKLWVQRGSEGRKTNQAIRFAGVRATLSSQRKTFASAIKRFWPGKAAPRATWNSRTRKSCSAKPWKGVSHWK